MAAILPNSPIRRRLRRNMRYDQRAALLVYGDPAAVPRRHLELHVQRLAPVDGARRHVGRLAVCVGATKEQRQ